MEIGVGRLCPAIMALAFDARHLIKVAQVAVRLFLTGNGVASIDQIIVGVGEVGVEKMVGDDGHVAVDEQEVVVAGRAGQEVSDGSSWDAVISLASAPLTLFAEGRS